MGKGEGFGEKGVEKNFLRLYVVVALLLVIGLGFMFINMNTSDDLGGLFFNEKFDLFSVFGLNEEWFFEASVNVVGNSPPVIIDLDKNIYACENKRLRYEFEVRDDEGQDVSVLINPPNPFFVVLNEKYDEYLSSYEIISGILDVDLIDAKRIGLQGWGVYEEEITASDGEMMDREDILITIIEVNDAPFIEDIGVKTIWTVGDDSEFKYLVNASDEETDYDFSLEFLDALAFFEIDENGYMNVKGNESLIGVYNLRVCVEDEGLKTVVHSQKDICLPEGDVLPLISCDEFSLTITNDNRAPVITSYSPNYSNFSVLGTEDVYFNVSERDPDGTIPDVYWYVEDVMIEHDEGESFDEFRYNFGCGVGGEFVVRAVATDGLLNDSVEWNVSVELVGCASAPVSGGGGGGGGGVYCEEEWVCEDWFSCRILNSDFDREIVSKFYENEINERCDVEGYNDDYCGYQNRKCQDLGKCGSTQFILPSVRACYYTENPNCEDGIKNCHHGFCEILIDCGGSCSVCPTCEDGIMNQGEQEVDCGGPCSVCSEDPSKKSSQIKMIITYSLIGIIILVIGLIVYEIKKKKKVKEYFSKKINGVYISFAFAIVLVLIGGYLFNIYNSDFVVLEVGGGLGSQSFLGGFVKGFADFFSLNVVEVLIGSNADLMVWDDTDVGGVKYSEGSLYGKEESDWLVNFYANYTDKNGDAVLGGSCSIDFSGDVSGMVYDNGLWSFSRSFTDKGIINFEISCSGLEDLSILSSVNIMNTPHQIDLNLPVLEYSEEEYSSYDFGSRVKEDDANDFLSYTIQNISGSEPDGYDWIWMEDSLIVVNASEESETGYFDLGIEVRDSSGEAVSRIQVIYISPYNDAPFFVNLEDKIFGRDDLFEYYVDADDEENDLPFDFKIEYLSCSNFVLRGDCALLQGVYSEDEIGINISFVPVARDVGEYEINFSVADSNNSERWISRVVNFTVVLPLWEDVVVVDYNLVEDSEFNLDLKNDIVEAYRDSVSFSSEDSFFSFNLSEDGLINFIAEDVDVGYYRFRISVTDGDSVSPKWFSFNISNVHDDVSIVRPLTGGNVFTIDDESNIEVFENAKIEIFLFADDDDFLIEQKDVYLEDLDVDLKIEGPDENLFSFVFDSFILDNRANYIAEFVPRDDAVGVSKVSVNVSDESGNSDFIEFDLTVINRDYDVPEILYPGEGHVFGFFEGVGSDVVFRVNHSIGDELEYNFYVDGVLVDSRLFVSNGLDSVWSYTLDYDSETYGVFGEFELFVVNPFFPDLNASRIWDMEINHTNSPVVFSGNIGDKILPYNYNFQIDLKDYFYDADYFDEYYNQNVTFEFVMVNSSVGDNKSYVSFGEVLDDWTVVLSSSLYAPYTEVLKINGMDWNESGVMTSAESNEFYIEFIEPPIVTVPTPSSGGGGGGGSSGKPIALKIITPGEVSGYEGELVEIPIQLINNGKGSFNDISLSSSAFKDGELINEIETSLDVSKISVLKSKDKRDLTLTVFLGSNKSGRYEIMIKADSVRPKYSDWGKFYINLEKINETDLRERLVFTENFILENSVCADRPAAGQRFRLNGFGQSGL